MALSELFLGDDWTQLGNIPIRLANLAPDAAYPTGGYPTTGALFGGAPTQGFQTANNGIRGIVLIGQNTASAGYIPVYNSQTGNWQVFESAAQAAAPFTAAPLAEVANGTNLSTLLFNVLVLLAGE